MRDEDEVLFPPDQRDPRWYADSPVMVRWDARRELEVAVVASALLDGTVYDEDFYDWYETELGLMVGGDPVFVLDLKISEEYRDPEALVAAHAGLDALATFGSMTSPLVTFDVDKRRGLSRGWNHGCVPLWGGNLVPHQPATGCGGHG